MSSIQNNPTSFGVGFESLQTSSSDFKETTKTFVDDKIGELIKHLEEHLETEEFNSIRIINQLSRKVTPPIAGFEVIIKSSNSQTINEVKNKCEEIGGVIFEDEAKLWVDRNFRGKTTDLGITF